MLSQARTALRLIAQLSTRAVPSPALCCASTHLFGRQQRRHGSSFTPSDEQQKIASLCSDQNVLVSARPGSGKTATVEAIVAAHPDKHACAILFMKQLQNETASRLKSYSNVDVLTFHGMGGKLAGSVMPNDAALLKHRTRFGDTGESFSWNHEPYDIVILDEFQDCSEIIFWLVAQFISANNAKLKLRGRPPARLVTLGDEPQCIYQFFGADPRYLTLAPELLRPLTPYAFTTVPLSRSFRLSKQTVQCINDVFLGGEQRIVSQKEGPKPIFVRCFLDRKRAQVDLARKLAGMIQRYGPENTAIIAPSIRTKRGPLQNLVNALADSHQIPIFVANNNEMPPDDKVIYGKLCATTFHQFKGRERDLVIVFGADASYFKYIDKASPHHKCPNALYVALTRAVKQLVIVHNEEESVLPFMQVDALYKTAEVFNMTGNKKVLGQPSAPDQKADLKLKLPSKVDVCIAIQHVSDSFLGTVIARELSIQKLSEPLPKKDHLAMHNIVPAGPKLGMHETTSDINGMVVAMAFEHQTTGEVSSLGAYRYPPFKRSPVDSVKYVAWLSRMACRYEAHRSGYRPRFIQMKNHKFNWIRPEHLAVAVSRARDAIGDPNADLRFEFTTKGDISVDEQEVQISGLADIVSVVAAPSGGGGDGGRRQKGEIVDVIWEIKFVHELSLQHIVQVCFYGYLLSLTSGKVPRMILFNARDNETLQIEPRDGKAGLRRMIEDILREKYTPKAEQDTADLIKQCADITSGVLQSKAGEPAGTLTGF